jgi:hypothetical protein
VLFKVSQTARRGAVPQLEGGVVIYGREARHAFLDSPVLPLGQRYPRSRMTPLGRPT